jgi:hypothetical protein
MTEFELSDKRMALLGHSGGRFPRGAARPGLDRRVWPLHHEDRTPTHGYEPTRGLDGGVREELAAGSDRRRNGILWAGLSAVKRLSARRW